MKSSTEPSTAERIREILAGAGYAGKELECQIGFCPTLEHAEAAAAGAERRRIEASEPKAPPKNGTVSDLPAGFTVIDRAPTNENVGHLSAGEYNAPARVVTMSTIKREYIGWLWQARFARASINIIDGDPGVGKSTITLDVAARVTMGEPMPLETERSEPADVLLIGQEDHLAATTLPRLVAANADLTRVHVLEAVPQAGDPDAPPTLADVHEVERIVMEKKIAVVFIDPLMAHLPSGTNDYRDADMRRALSPWAVMAQRTGAAIVIVRHLRKMGGSAIYRGGSSIGIIGQARSALLVGRDPDDPDLCVLAHSKGNLAKPPPSIRYRVVDCDGVGRIEWISEVECSADRLAALRDPSGDNEVDPVKKACEALREVLAYGPVSTKQATADVRAMTGCSDRTVERARHELGVEAVRVTDQSAKVKGWMLQLPGGGVESASRPPRSASGGVVASDSSISSSSMASFQTATKTPEPGGVEPGGVEQNQTAATRSTGGVERQTTWSTQVMADARHRGLHDEDE